MNKKDFTGKLTLTAVAVGCIFLTSSAMAAEPTQITLDSAAIQQAFDQANQGSNTKQASSMPAPSAIQQQMQKQLKPNANVIKQQVSLQATPAGQLGAPQLDPAIQTAVNKKMLTTMEETMQDTFSNPEIMKEMQKQVMSERMDDNFLQESMQPMIMDNMRGTMQGSVKQ